MLSTDIYTLLKSKSKNDHYLNRYIKFINSLKHQQKVKYKTDAHHILPKANDLFPEYKSFKIYPWNKINLSYRQHFIAHLMLYKIFGGSQSQVIFLFSNKIKNYNSRLYEQAKKEKSKIMKNNSFALGIKHTPEQNKQKAIRQKGKKRPPRTTTHRKNISISKSGKNHPNFNKSRTKIKIANKLKKYYIFKSPNGEIVDIFGLKDFCLKNNLHYSNMCQVAKGNVHSCNGWTLP